MTTDDVERGLFSRPALNASFLFSPALPGPFMPITQEEYDAMPPAVQARWDRDGIVLDRSNQMPIDPVDQPLTRRTLRAYHPKITDFLLRVVNDEKVHYRQATNSIMLYPPDGSANVTVYARNSDRQLRSLTQWHDKHIGPSVTDEPAEVADEVTVPEVDVTPASIHVHPVAVTPADPQPVDEPVDEPRQDPDPDEDHWATYFGTDGDPIELIETDGAWYRCRGCREQGEEWITYSAAGIGGHIRMKHRDRSGLRTPEAMAKSLDTRRYNALARHVEAALAELNKGMKHAPQEQKIAELQAENAILREQLAEAQARLDLIREAYGA